MIYGIKKYHGQGIHGIHLMPVGWDEVVPRIVMEAVLMPKDFLQNYGLGGVVPAGNGGLSNLK